MAFAPYATWRVDDIMIGMERKKRPFFETPAEATEGEMTESEYRFCVIWGVLLILVVIICAFL